MDIHVLRELLNDQYYGHALTDALFILTDYMEDVSDGNISISSGNLGINVTSTEIEIVDIPSGTGLATFTLTFND